MIEAELLKGFACLRHGFFTREGGVSRGTYATLNCGFGSRDDPAHIRENRARVALGLAAEPHCLITPYQAHTASAVIADAPWAPGNAPEADAIVTSQPGLAVGVLTADCAPVLMAEAKAGVIAAAHAGWRGAKGGVLEAAIEAMETLGAQRANIAAVIGPAISASIYEVGTDFRESFITEEPESADLFHIPPGGAKPHFDLPGYILRRLAAAGIAQSGNLGLCTYQNESLFYSYRRANQQKEPDYGRQISAIVLV